MAVMSFAHLKKNQPPEKKEEPVKAEPEEQDLPSRKRDPHLLIMESKFCYGCEAFSMDAPDTEKEVGWCKRETKNKNEWEFKRIPVTALIRQCPLERRKKELAR